MNLTGDVLNLITDFISKQFLVRALHIRHMVKVLMSSIVFCQRLSLVYVSTGFHMWKLRFHGLCTFHLQIMYVQGAQIFKSHEKEAKKLN